VSSLFSAISAKGKVTMPLADTFWGARLECTDQFGINWMFNFRRRR
jgi:PhnB protein